tara:strand:+ start:26656 stop:27039 length:384 start_codon:yes stop_codon:yes gene_type:complete
MKQLLYPQEIEVHYIIPALKRQLALAFKEQGLKQKEIAQILHIEDATVSQYINKKRGAQISLPEELKKEVKKSTILINDKISLLRETQRLIHLARTSGVICEVHKKISQIPDECHTNLIGCFGGVVK